MQHVGRKICVLVVCLIAASAAGLFAGDVATFANLGFSADSNHFAFALYGMDAGTARPYAELYVVDTRNNSFVRDGVFKASYPVAPQPGLAASGALLKLYAEALPKLTQFSIDPLNQGRPLYLYLDTGERSDTINFRDFRDSSLWQVQLSKTVQEQSGSFVSSFGLNFSVERNGSKVEKNAGNPAFKRANVSDYAIQQVLVGPDNKTVVFVIERKEVRDGRTLIRFMVETVRLP